MITIRLTGKEQDLKNMLNILKSNDVEILEESKPYRNSNSSLYRMYIKIKLEEKQNENN